MDTVDVGLLAAVGTLVGIIAAGLAAWQVGLAIVSRRDQRLRHEGAESEPATTGASLGVPLGRLPADVRGREDLLGTLIAQVPHGGLVVLAGMGGVGKSTVAAEFVRRVQVRRFLRRHRSRQVWWVSGASAASLTAGLVSVARRLGGSRRDLEAIDAQAPDAPDRLWTLLEHAPRGWLLLIDNADDPHLLAAPALRAGATVEAGPISQVADGTGWVRASQRGLVLVSSRQGDQRTWGSQAAVHRLWPLGDTEAGRVLRDLAPRAGDQAQAEALGRRLGGLPLALHLAGLNMGSEITRWSTFEAYREALDQDPAPGRLLSMDSDIELAREQRAIVMRTWELSLDALAERGLPQGRALLRLLSCYAPALPIPRSVLAPELLSSFLKAQQATGGAVTPSSEQVLRSLARLGLIDIWAEQDAVVVHPVVADTNRGHLLAPTIPPDPEPLRVRQTAVTLVAGAVGTLDEEQPSDWPRFSQLAPHLLALLGTTADHLDGDHVGALATAAANVAGGFHWAQAISSASTLMSAARALSQRLGDHHPAILSVRNQLAYEIGEQGKWSEAEAAYREVLEARQQVLGHSHHDTVATRYSLAFVVARQGRWAEAESIYQEVLETWLRELGADHPSTLAARHYLARVVADRGRWAEAEAAFREVLEAKQRVLGGDHPSTLITRHYLALVVAWRGGWAKAEADFRELLEVRQRVLGADHPSTLTTRWALAPAAAEQGRWAEAEAALRGVLEARQRVLGDDHPDTLHARYELARAAANQGRWPEAEAALRKVLEAQRRVLGNDNRDSLRTRHELARAAAEQGRLTEAEAAFREILDARQRVLGHDHPDTLRTLDVLGDAERRRPLQA